MRVFTDKIGANALTARAITINVVLITNAFVWYYFISSLLDNAIKDSQISQNAIVTVWLLHFAGIAFSALIGAAFARKIKNRSKLILVWMIAGTILSALSLLVDLTYLPILLVFSLSFGIALGIGMPSCMGYFSENISVERRALTAGIIFSLSGVIMAVLATIAGEDIALQAIILTIWRLFGVLAFLPFIILHVGQALTQSKPAGYRQVFTQKSFLLYLIPWTLFSLIAYLSVPVQTAILASMQATSSNVPSIASLRLIENVLMAFSAVVCGFLIDRVGRKRVAIVGFVMLGLGYSFVGLQPYNTISWYVYTLLDGIAFTILYVIFVITIWSDLSSGYQSEKYYAIGVLPFFVSFLLRFTTSSEIASTISGNSLFSFIAVFLFIAVLPLVYAPETLPEKVLKDRDLKSYIEKAKAKAEKDSTRIQQKDETNAKST